MQTRCLGCMEEFDDSFGLCPICGYEPDTEVESPIHMQPGVILKGRYLIGRVLGFGGFGVTYIGWDFTLQQKVAVKEYLPSEFATRLIGQTQVTVFGGKKEEQFDDGMSQFVEEAKRLAQFQNEEGIVRIYDSFAENNTAYIIMEYLDGETLTAYLERNGKIPVDDAVNMLLPVLKSLDTVHKAGIIHRDIAPDNILLTKDGRVKLIDFGAARYATTSHSRSLTVIIKPGYSPEEQYRSRGNQGPHTDVYALSAVLYKMVTGIVLPDSMERRACFEKNGKDIVIPVSKNCKISKSQENAIMNALNVRVEDRTPTAAKFAEELTGSRPVKRIFGRIKMLDLMRWPLWAKIAIPTAGAAVLTMLILLFTGIIGPKGSFGADISLTENEARVPNVISCSADMAQSMLLSQGLNCTIVGAEYSDTIPGNTVIYQNVNAGQVVEKGTNVELYISVDMGIRPDEIVPEDSEEGAMEEASDIPVMPYLVYKPAAEAKAILEAMGLKVKIEEVYDDAIAAGLVVRQDVDAGSDMSAGGTITLEVSKGIDPDKEDATEENVTLPKREYSLYVGDSVMLVPAGGDGTYRYSSSNEAVAKVSKNGTVEAVGTGTAKITVKSGNKAKEATCTITVKDYTMSLTPKSVTLFIDGTANLSVSGIPSNAEVTWKSGNTGVAKVNAGGKVTGVGAGSTTITASWKNGRNTYSATAKVTVESMGITLSTYKISSFYVGETRTITASTSPANQKVSWKSSDTTVATVNSSGVVTAVGGGKATITASFGDYSENCAVTVTQPGISMTKESVTLYVGDSTSLSAAVTPNGAEVKWSSDDSSIAKISDNTITAVGGGKTTIRAKMTYAGTTYTATCKVTVKKPGVSISQESASLMPGDAITLTASAAPSDCEIKWSSSDSSVATVSGGQVKAVGIGSAKITAKITYAGKDYKASCIVSVEKPSIKVTASADTIEYSERDQGTVTLKAKVKPDNGKIEWTMSNSAVATLSGSGNEVTVKAKSEGTVEVTATYTANGTKVQDTCTLTVKKAASTLSASNIRYPSKSTIDAFTFSADIRSNYQLETLYIQGQALSNALGIPVTDSATFAFDDGIYETGAAEAAQITEFLKARYRALYDAYGSLAGGLGLDTSVTITINATVTDSSGATAGCTINYILEG